jgi:hypothetical protein
LGHPNITVQPWHPFPNAPATGNSSPPNSSLNPRRLWTGRGPATPFHVSLTNSIKGNKMENKRLDV